MVLCSITLPKIWNVTIKIFFILDWYRYQEFDCQMMRNVRLRLQQLTIDHHLTSHYLACPFCQTSLSL